MSKSTSSDKLDTFLETYEDYNRYETDILNIANKNGIVGYLFTQDEVASRFPALLSSWHAPLKNPGTFEEPDPSDKENVRAADPNAFNRHKAAAKEFKSDISELNNLRLAVITSLPPTVRHSFENTCGKFAELRSILQHIREKFSSPDTAQLQKALARCQEPRNDRQTVEQFIDVHIVVHNLFADAKKPIPEFQKLLYLMDSAKTSDDRYTVPLQQFTFVPKEDQTFKRLATLLITWDNSNGISYSSASAFAATTHGGKDFKTMSTAEKRQIKETFTSSTPASTLKSYIDSFDGSKNAGNKGGGKRKDKFCTCHGQGGHDTASCSNGGKPCNGKGPLNALEFTHYNVDGSKYIPGPRPTKKQN